MEETCKQNTLKSNKLAAEFRSPQVKAKKLRKDGLIPCSLFGSRYPQTQQLQVQQREAEAILKKRGVGVSVDIALDGQIIPALVREASRNTVTRELEQISFWAYELDQKIETAAKIVIQNREKVPGSVMQVLFTLPYAAYAADLIDNVVIDLSAYPVGSRITVGDLPVAANDKLTLGASPETLVVSIDESRRAVTE